MYFGLEFRVMLFRRGLRTANSDVDQDYAVNWARLLMLNHQSRFDSTALTSQCVSEN